jgi:hypothetical protein
MTLTQIHSQLSTSIMLFAGIAALWGLVSYLRGKEMEGSFWGILAVGELLFLSQVVIGILLWLNNARPARGVHILYGIVTVLAIPAYYTISKGKDDRTATLAYTLICVFLVGIASRAVMTAGM